MNKNSSTAEGFWNAFLLCSSWGLLLHFSLLKTERFCRRETVLFITPTLFIVLIPVNVRQNQCVHWNTLWEMLPCFILYMRNNLGHVLKWWQSSAWAHLYIYSILAVPFLLYHPVFLISTWFTLGIKVIVVMWEYIPSDTSARSLRTYFEKYSTDKFAASFNWPCHCKWLADLRDRLHRVSIFLGETPKQDRKNYSVHQKVCFFSCKVKDIFHMHQ